MAVTKKSTQVEARADTSTPDLADQAKAGYAEASGIDPTSYRYIGGLDMVVVVVGGTAYDFRKGDPVHLAHPDKGLDDNPDFERVEEAG
jgi:hypothetical protein